MARLVLLEGRRRIQTQRLGREPITLGRDPSCDVVLEPARVSRIHARVQPVDDAYVLVDLDSANGTVLNGDPVDGAVTLRHGDHIEIAGQSRLRYEERPPVARRTAFALAAAGAVALAAALCWPSGEDPVLREAVALAREAMNADAAGDASGVRDRLQAAAGLLLREGRLEAAPGQGMPGALDRLSEAVGGGVDLAPMLHRAVEATRPPPPAPRTPSGPCRLDAVEPARLDACLRARVRSVMAQLGQPADAVPDGFPAEVARQLRREHAFLAASLDRARAYEKLVTDELARARMTPLLRYVALIESGYREQARSAGGAVGLWQLPPGLARDYGLTVSAAEDERTDSLKSTRAAVRCLKDLSFEFGGDAVLLAVASYERGEMAVRAALARLADPFGERAYWDLVRGHHLPRETARYVTRFVAAAVAGEAGLPREEALRAAGY